MSAALPTPQALRALMARMESGLLERAEAVRLALLAALAGEHVLLIGPPGTAKSELARRLQHAFAGARYFERLLTRFSVPEELFGPLSLKALEDDRYERLTDGYLPTASVAFLDEVFKANSAILNALLTLLNEREFDNGRAREKTPLISVVGATNEVPTDDALQAFYDRFLVRVPVAAVGDASFDALLDLAPRGSDDPAALGRAAIDAVQAGRHGVALGPQARTALHGLRVQAAQMQLTVSDRRWRQLVQLLRTQALCTGRDRVEPVDLWVAPYCVAEQPQQVPALQAWFLDEVLAAPVLEAAWLTRAVEAFEKQFEIESQVRQEDGDAGKLALARSIGMTQTEGGMTRLVSVTLEERVRKHYSALHVAARAAQVDDVAAPALAQLRTLQTHAADVLGALAASVWVPPPLRQQVHARLDASLRTLAALVARLQGVGVAFASLPVDAALQGEAPAPVVIAA